MNWQYSSSYFRHENTWNYVIRVLLVLSDSYAFDMLYLRRFCCQIFETLIALFCFIELLCKDPGDIPHGKRQSDGFELGKQVKYSCMPGFTMQGSSTLTCTKTRAWDKVKPSCTCERTNKQAFRNCRKQCNPDSSSCKDKQCVCDGDCGFSCVPKGCTFFWMSPVPLNLILRCAPQANDYNKGEHAFR